MSCCNQSITVINLLKLWKFWSTYDNVYNGYNWWLYSLYWHVLPNSSCSNEYEAFMNLPKKDEQKNKLLCAASIPYYVGKSFSYASLAISWFGIRCFTKSACEVIRSNFDVNKQPHL